MTRSQPPDPNLPPLVRGWGGGRGSLALERQPDRQNGYNSTMNETLHETTLPGFPEPEEGAEEVAARALAAALAARAERAAGLLRAGAVESLGEGRFKVRSAGGGYYAVREGYCNCPDFAWRGVVPCKHIIAVDLVRPFLEAAA